jgi:putative endonuclease
MRPIAYVYILTNKNHTVLYTGMTTDLRTRLWEHQTRRNLSGFTARYNVIKPVYYEGHATIEDALNREKYIKGKVRSWKEDLIRKMNPDWNDLTNEIMNMEP